MSSNSEMVDSKAALSKYGIGARTVPKPTVRYGRTTGFMFVYIDGDSGTTEAANVLQETIGVDYVLTPEEASSELHLRYVRIGDLIVNGTKDVVFGDPNEVHLPPRLHSHTSTYEQAIPLQAEMVTSMSSNSRIMAASAVSSSTACWRRRNNLLRLIWFTL